MGASERIFDRLVPEWIDHQKLKAKDYNSGPAVDPKDPMGGFENADVLGIPGQFAEIWRKIWKLKKGMWDGETLVGEQPREILLDFIGHCFLAIDMIDRKAGEQVTEEAKTQRLVIDRHRIAEGWTSDELLAGHRYDGCPICLKRRDRAR